MRTKLRPIIGAMALAMSVSPGAAIAGAPDDDIAADALHPIETIPETYVEHALAGDWDAVADLYHPEAIQVLPDGPPVEGRASIRDALAGMFGSGAGVRLTDFAVDIAEVEVLGPSIYVRATYRFEAELLGNAGGASAQHGPYVNILRQDTDGTWRIWRQFVGRAHPPVGTTAE